MLKLTSTRFWKQYYTEMTKLPHGPVKLLEDQGLKPFIAFTFARLWGFYFFPPIIQSRIINPSFTEAFILEKYPVKGKTKSVGMQ